MLSAYTKAITKLKSFTKTLDKFSIEVVIILL